MISSRRLLKDQASQNSSIAPLLAKIYYKLAITEGGKSLSLRDSSALRLSVATVDGYFPIYIWAELITHSELVQTMNEKKSSWETVSKGTFTGSWG